eukprot:CAMPEP_0114410546 /NCGR_PEP_ID=MMETSP0102-20121206/24109_1 /TAXON_ID=38822 ORGANISM="Pteridomonas danica, Strain PT" /NCGR_SAMPLE_ID=MMETSP0102 /ASSEMBLY_ACC=CAM_ASM_000212 /LENGTH=66 /DNA_ID=CAMNT_0001578239 /DNA_START=47 /DNA_END=244 /DNA_ORIENTATION=+
MITEKGFSNENIIDYTEQACLMSVGNHNIVPHATESPGHIDTKDEEVIEVRIQVIWIISRVLDNKD